MMSDRDLVTDNTARDVLGHFAEHGGWEPGGFIQSLLVTITKADPVNKRLLAEGFPEHVTAMIWAQETYDGIQRLQAIVGVES
jgi:hypothetical protein